MQSDKNYQIFQTLMNLIPSFIVYMYLQNCKLYIHAFLLTNLPTIYLVTWCWLGSFPLSSVALILFDLRIRLFSLKVYTYLFSYKQSLRHPQPPLTTHTQFSGAEDWGMRPSATPPPPAQPGTNHFSVELRQLLFTIYIWLYDFDQEL